MLPVGFLIEAAEEVDGVEVLASAEFVGDPFTLFARVIEIQHGGDCIYAYAVDVIFVEPEHGARHQEAADFGAAIVKNVRLPVGMEPLARVCVLVKMRAVEVGQAVSIGREVRRYPVEDDPDAVLVQVVDQIHEILRRAVARSGSEVSGGLVSPGPVKGMLHHGQELDVSETQLADVFGEAGRGFAVGQGTVVIFGDAHPRAQVHFVNRLRRAKRVAGGALLHPVVVVPLVVEVPDDGGGARRFLVQQAERVGLIDVVPVALRFDVEFVERAFSYSSDEALPDARGAAGGETVGLGVPLVETANDGYGARIGGPYAEHRAGLAIVGEEVGSHLFVEAVVAAFVEEVEILVGKELEGGEGRFRAHGGGMWARLSLPEYEHPFARICTWAPRCLRPHSILTIEKGTHGQKE